MQFFDKKETILFQGDSITDCGRNCEDTASLGDGYPLVLASILPIVYPQTEFTFINRGISGHHVCDLAARWEQDCTALNPTTVSVLIGINDTGHRYNKNIYTSTEDFERDYRDILGRTAKLGAKIIIMEPFILHVNEELRIWHEDLDPKILAIRKLAAEFGALYISLDGLFAAASMRKPPQFWAGDGVHPTPAGHGFIADAWMKALV